MNNDKWINNLFFLYWIIKIKNNGLGELCSNNELKRISHIVGFLLNAGAAIQAEAMTRSVLQPKFSRLANAFRLDVSRDTDQRRRIGVDHERLVGDDQSVGASSAVAPFLEALVHRSHEHFQAKQLLELDANRVDQRWWNITLVIHKINNSMYILSRELGL